MEVPSQKGAIALEHLKKPGPRGRIHGQEVVLCVQWAETGEGEEGQIT